MYTHVALWDADLADVWWLKYLLVAIEIFMRYLWFEPLKNKLHETIIKALQNVFRLGRITEELRTDKGGVEK